MRLLKFVILFFVFGCSQPKEQITVDNRGQKKLSSNIEEHYLFFKNRSNVIGFSHYQTCDDKSREHINFLRDSATKSDLLFMLNDSCEMGFKVFLVEEIHKDFPELDSLILSNFGSDTSEIYVVTSCFGIKEKFAFGKICNNIIMNNSITLAFNALPPPPLPPPSFRLCDSIRELAKIDYKNGKKEHITLGYVPNTEFEDYYSNYMKMTFDIKIKASCTSDFNEECYINSMNEQIKKEFGENFINETRGKARVEFEKNKESKTFLLVFH